MEPNVQKARSVTFLGLFLNIVLFALKMAAGFLGHSVAIVADAFHSLSDLSTDLAVLWGVKEANRPVDKCHDYGHGKIETLVALFIAVFLFFVGGKIFWDAALEIHKFISGGELLRPGWIALAAALLSVVSKEWIYRRTVTVSKEIDSPALLANAWHHRTDALSSLGALLGIGGAILLGDHWRVLDPAAAALISVFILRMAVTIFSRSSNELIDASLPEEEEKEILRLAGAVSGAETPHNLRTRRIGNTIAIEMHIKVDPRLNITDAHNIATGVEQALKKRFGQKIFVSVHVEPQKTDQ